MARGGGSREADGGSGEAAKGQRAGLRSKENSSTRGERLTQPEAFEAALEYKKLPAFAAKPPLFLHSMLPPRRLQHIVVLGPSRFELLRHSPQKKPYGSPGRRFE